MKSKFMLIISIILFVVAIIILWKTDNHVIGSAFLLISLLINLIRQFIYLWNNRRVK
ncbi:hypothetical protein B0P06_004526 [Clostridium saccharoperbutylacetonicum]|uniref:Uncharacterized protein n=1 Tax=Clostridium saccharoperbutylacetonicum N1-4(HMT) TaxID=931276 RepID=M1MGY6_9CLOT|nr:hypothetical protein Cspa_c34230 [Clostridium saccharoperbutylacetonicum N1-4(HMT)]AQR95871.1 hypothetical protein CLSAP_31870 [Clostridium saccharoperbutylacetonicum]NRT62057.1 hypothetical protein [Clostridium saccharoperbutylacetonicum]NSB25387.1 hypothetical protein [Clostridium saccharoperbutylacetonicum]NSB31734.1 hypothetical protein [Clostridium saccharoperbutylacetonicum]